MQVVVVCTVLVVLEGDHGEGEGPHAARAPVGQPHLQAYGVTHPAGCGLTVTWLSVHQHVCKGHGARDCQGQWPVASPSPVCSFICSSIPSPLVLHGCPLCHLGSGVCGAGPRPSPSHCPQGHFTFMELIRGLPHPVGELWWGKWVHREVLMPLGTDTTGTSPFDISPPLGTRPLSGRAAGSVGPGPPPGPGLSQPQRRGARDGAASVWTPPPEPRQRNAGGGPPVLSQPPRASTSSEEDQLCPEKLPDPESASPGGGGGQSEPLKGAGVLRPGPPGIWPLAR